MSKKTLPLAELEEEMALELPDRRLLGGSLIDVDVDVEDNCVTIIVVGDDKAC
jgi:hypothetical protein